MTAIEGTAETRTGLGQRMEAASKPNRNCILAFDPGGGDAYNARLLARHRDRIHYLA